jgi:hypothetical protein
MVSEDSTSRVMVFPVRLLGQRLPTEKTGHPRLDEDLHTTSESQDEVKGRLLLNVYLSACELACFVAAI